MLTSKIDKELLLDILTDGYESGSGRFWAEVDHWKWRRWYVDAYASPMVIKPELTEDSVLVRMRAGLHAEGPEDAWKEWHDITLRNLEEATQWALVHYNHTFQGFHTNEKNIIDDIQYDAISADIVLQKIVLGDVVYG